MARPSRCRRICAEPAYDSFVPKGIASGDPIRLTVDEYEVLRLVDLEKLTHEQCARQIGVSRTTVTDTYESAREKLADCLVNGRQLIIAGGNYSLCSGSAECVMGERCGRTAEESNGPAMPEKGNHLMRIAVCYENEMIFQHFGHTAQFKLYDIENGAVVRTQVVDTNGQGHGALAGFLADGGIDVLICGGIGGGAQMALAQMGIRLCGGVSGSCDAAVAALLDGTLDHSAAPNCSHHEHSAGHSCGEHSCGHNCR